MALNKRKIGLIFVILSLLLLSVLVFVKSEIDSQEAFLCEAVHSNPDLEMDQCPAHTSNLSWLFVVAFGVAFLFLGIGIYIMFMPAQAKTVENKVDLSKLDDDEKKIYGLLKQNEGSMYQSDIMKELEFSKVQTTRILDKLESKKIIDRKRRGMTNIVVLR